MRLQLFKTWRNLSITLRHHTNSIYSERLYYTKPLVRKYVLENNVSFHKRTLFSFFRKPSVDDLKEKDNVPEFYNLIYKSTLKKYFVVTQIVTSTSVCLFTLLLTYTKSFDYSKDLIMIQGEDSNLIFLLTLFISVTGGVQYLLSRVPIRIYNFPKKKEYIIVCYGLVPLTLTKYSCSIGEVTELNEKNFLIPWNEANYLLQTKDVEMKLTLFIDSFKRPADLYIMLGVQSDPDVEDIKSHEKQLLDKEDFEKPKEEK